jgi:hypothetical protein
MKKLILRKSQDMKDANYRNKTNRKSLVGAMNDVDGSTTFRNSRIAEKFLEQRLLQE